MPAWSGTRRVRVVVWAMELRRTVEPWQGYLTICTMPTHPRHRATLQRCNDSLCLVAGLDSPVDGYGARGTSPWCRATAVAGPLAQWHNGGVSNLAETHAPLVVDCRPH